MRIRHREAIVLATVCVSMATTVINLSMLNIGLPSLARQLGATNTGLEWIVDAYALVFAGFLLAAGSLGDRLGRKRVMMTGLAIFGVTSGVAALTHTAGELIAARCGMGLGAALVMPVTLSILTEIYPNEAGMRRAIGVWAATGAAGGVLAPVVAGGLLSAFWWGSLFLVNVPLAAISIVAAALFVRESAPRRDAAIDWTGVVLSILFSTGLVFAFIEGPDLGWSDPLPIASLLGSGVALVAFCVIELRSSEPLIDVRCFRIPSFSVGSAMVGLQYFLGFGMAFVITQYIQLVLGLSPLAAGLSLMPTAAVVMIAAPYGAKAFGRFGARAVIVAVLPIAAAGVASVDFAGVNSSVAVIITSMMLLNVAIGLMSAGTTSIVMNAVPRQRAGMASGAQTVTRQLGGALGVAVLGSILAARYTSGLSAAGSHSAISRYLPEARRSLAAALQAAPVGSPAQSALARAARSAFVDGMHTAAWLSAGIAVVSAAVVFVALRSKTAPALETALAAVPDH